MPRIIIAAILLIPVAIAVQVSVWNECRTDHSFFYCMALISNK